MYHISAKKILIIGLGNPGSDYSGNRHNIGFMVVDELAASVNGRFSKSRLRSEVCAAEIAAKQAVLAKPQTFMNLSGDAAASLIHYYKMDLAEMMVVHDDMDLGFGRIRIKVGGGDGGHKGIRSIINTLKVNSFVRIRVGVGRPPSGTAPDKFVLSDFAADEGSIVRDLISRACEAVRLVLTDGLTRAQNMVHSDQASESAA